MYTYGFGITTWGPKPELSLKRALPQTMSITLRVLLCIRLRYTTHAKNWLRTRSDGVYTFFKHLS